MRVSVRNLSCAFWMALAAGAAPAAADCKQAALDALRASAPDGYAVYQRLSDKKFFRGWIGCRDVQMSLPTAVHESVHFITSEEDVFPLVGGGDVARPHQVSKFYAPYRIAGDFKRDDYTDTYLRQGRATSSTDFLYLLDEMNAYTHDLNAAMDLKALRKPDAFADSRDGLAALMAFVAVYVDRARRREPDTWEGLQAPETSKALAALWDRAEKTMEASCGLPNFGSEDKTFIARVCKPDLQASLAGALGAEPGCAQACLKADEQAADAELSAEASQAIPPPATARTIWSRRTKRRVSSAGDLGQDPPGE